MARTTTPGAGEYERKRDFTVTPEPRTRSGRATRRRAHRLSFVIQKHAARRLHYDFRLELDGALKSWAVPKGPSLDPSDKRMAMHVEDHPLEYAGFEGVIPPGQYGAGTVIVWDRGEWEPDGDPHDGFRDGKLKFTLRGEKLHGGWTLVRMGGRRKRDDKEDAWLLIKERDADARPASEFDVVEALPDSVLTGTAAKGKAGKAASTGATSRATGGTARGRKSAGKLALPEGAKRAALPLSLAPELATLVDEPPADTDGWLYEIKFDGYRLLARVDGDDVRLFTRQGNDWTPKLKTLATAVRALGLPDGWLDGEIVMPDKHGRPDFQALQNAFESAHVESIRYFLFDLPYYAGHDLRAVPLTERRALLRHLFEHNTSPRLQFSESFEASPQELLATACRMKFEGLIGKRADAPYISRRTNAWIKLKCTLRQEFVIAGFTDPKGSRSGFGALLLGVHDEHGRLRYAGNVGTGFDTRMLETLRKRLDEVRTDTPPFDHVPAGIKAAHWVRPKLVAEVSFGEWTRDGRVRHSVFHGLRTDKPAGAIGVEQAAEPPPARKTAGKSARKTAGKTAGNAAAREPAARTLRVTHADRVIDPSTGTTKGELVAFYERVAPLMLPHLRNRPIAMVRAPDGIEGERFFQRHGDTLRIGGVRALDPDLWPGHPALLEVTSEDGITAAAQFNVVEFHTWNASWRSIDKPNRIVFDLDPGEGVPWARMREAAGLVKGLLDELELAAFLKTSGGKGLHVVVPLTPRADWDEVREFAHAVVRHIARTLPQHFVSKSGPRNRVGKIFIDYLRNGIGATTVSAFSVRARPGLGVSLPLEWDALPALRASDQWTVANAAPRLAEIARADPWADYAGIRQTTSSARKRLGPHER